MARQAAPALEIQAHNYAATLALLEKLDAVESPEGQAALTLAEILDSGRSVMAAAANAQRMLAILDVIRESVPAQEDTVDDVRERREWKLRAAG